MHKGEIRVESEIDKGSDFIVTLNVSENAYTPEERSSESITTKEIRKRMKETIELIPEKPADKKKDPLRESVMVVENNKEMNGLHGGMRMKAMRRFWWSFPLSGKP
jgi:hypothetical protein